ncbi:hypothetical protein A3H26_00035 [candidate division WWE3 bacterium RIFCSPLOWO2_12_FULL_36_10]|uniref:TRAM domain-containing protein n=1 Tax=candidate division WWE3 bacterium RIFCSPLOWO2_12_FULL_36_10 TaxID=1802630 RepID=A0A1F4VKN0_UNCKA|nr:MAG: hypothetical protein A3H26_00035 [candidate division WWE3 bacterium RIFCSPLOWO2_12_FULL_36_10]
MVVKSKIDKPKIAKSLIRFAIKSALGAVFFIVGFNFSNTLFFHQNPLFGVPFLAEVLISITLGMFGFHTVPILAILVKDWIEKLVTKTISEIVGNFWDQQSKRMEESRRNKQKRKKEDIEQKLKEVVKGGVLIDTSVLIDGRIVDIIKTGFFDEKVLVTQSVMDELHLISDSENNLKRQRGRRGLVVLDDLKKVVKVVFVDDYILKGDGVDKQLVKLSRKYNAKLMTLDFNLNKLATVSGVSVLNLNELVNAVKAVVLPGEKLKIKIVQKVKEKEQGVGYLPDGTMVVVEGAKDKENEEVEAEITRVIQTQAGKMVFGIIKG